MQTGDQGIATTDDCDRNQERGEETIKQVESRGRGILATLNTDNKIIISRYKYNPNHT